MLWPKNKRSKSPLLPRRRNQPLIRIIRLQNPLRRKPKSNKTMNRMVDLRIQNQLETNATWAKGKIVVDVSQIGKMMAKQKQKKSIDLNNRLLVTRVSSLLMKRKIGLKQLRIIDARMKTLAKIRMKNLKKAKKSEGIGHKLERKKNRTLKQKPILISPSLNPKAKSNLTRNRKRWLLLRRKNLSSRKSVRLLLLSMCPLFPNASITQDTRNTRLQSGGSKKETCM